MTSITLKTLRLHLALSREQIASQLGMRTTTYAKHERMEPPPRLTLLGVSMLVMLARKRGKPRLPVPHKYKGRAEIVRIKALMVRIAALHGPAAVRDALTLERLVVNRRTYAGREVDAFLAEEIAKIY